MAYRLPPPDRFRNELHLAHQQLRIVIDPVVAVCDGGVATAITAQNLAERNMQVQRDGQLRVERIEPGRVGVRADLLIEMRRCRVTRIARQSFVEASEDVAIRRWRGRLPVRGRGCIHCSVRMYESRSLI